jgi:hypothetical protein
MFILFHIHMPIPIPIPMPNHHHHHQQPQVTHIFFRVSASRLHMVHGDFFILKSQGKLSFLTSISSSASVHGDELTQHHGSESVDICGCLNH